MEDTREPPKSVLKFHAVAFSRLALLKGEDGTGELTLDVRGRRQESGSLGSNV